MATKEQAPPNKRKKKKKKKKNTEPKRLAKSYGFSRRKSRITNKLSKLSQDLKYQDTLQKALMELKQKDEDYRYAIEIGEALTKENAYLKEQIEILESQLHHQEAGNTILRKKLETLHATYSQDLFSYHQDLQAHKQLVSELQTALQCKHAEQVQQKHAKDDVQHTPRVPDIATSQFAWMTDDQILNLSSKDMQSPFEKQLLKQLKKENTNHAQSKQTVESLMRKLDEMQRKYDTLKISNKELKQITNDELAQHIATHKAIEQEAIYLASRKANVEEERDRLVAELELRDYEITMLHQQLALERKEFESHNVYEKGSTLGDIINEDQYYEYHDPHDPYGDEVSDEVCEDEND
eukprot:128976_1